jgi:hypothetical protein
MQLTSYDSGAHEIMALREEAKSRLGERFDLRSSNRAVPHEKNLAIDAEAAYQIPYEAIIKGSLAFMLSHGQQPRKQLGHHIAIIEFAQKNLPGCPAGTFCPVRSYAPQAQRCIL